MRWTRYTADLCRILLLTLCVSACGESEPPPIDVTLAIEGPTEARPGDAIQFRAVQTVANRPSTDLTPHARWNSSNPSMLSVTAGLATVHSPGMVTLRAEVGQFRAAMNVRVVLGGIWDGAYTLTVGGGACDGTMPAELRQRTYPVTVAERDQDLVVTLPDGDQFIGHVLLPIVRFELVNGGYYGFLEPAVTEQLPDGNLLAISGFSVTNSDSPTGFSGPLLAGALTLYGPGSSSLIATCASSSHTFSLTRQ